MSIPHARSSGPLARMKRVARYIVGGSDASLQHYSASAPSAQEALDIFRGDWASAMPPPLDGCRAGALPLFADPRISWGAESLGGVAGLRVLELGPLEGGHSYMLQRLGADSVVAVEGNARAYLKCLVVKQLLGLDRVEFLYGDFVEYLRGATDRFDLVVASGVLYHMEDPVELLARIAGVSDRLILWTHYYDEALIARDRRRRKRFTRTEPAERDGFRYTRHRYEYRASRVFTGFCGGSRPWSHWMSRDDLLACCRHVGLGEITIGWDDPDHENGPCFALVARRGGLLRAGSPV